jgi:hypothetical protein
MKYNKLKNFPFFSPKWVKYFGFPLLFFSIQTMFSQVYLTKYNSEYSFSNSDQNFLNRVRFGGNIGLVFSNQFSDVLIAPNFLYEFNEYFSAGVGLQFNYLKEPSNFETLAYGASLIGIANPLEFLQLSVEIEQLRFKVNYQSFPDENFWNTALFLGAGLRQENFTVGFRYNLLHLNKNGYFSEPFIPFVRFSF